MKTFIFTLLSILNTSLYAANTSVDLAFVTNDMREIRAESPRGRFPIEFMVSDASVAVALSSFEANSEYECQSITAFINKVNKVTIYQIVGLNKAYCRKVR